jgi:hypothetical protein
MDHLQPATLEDSTLTGSEESDSCSLLTNIPFMLFVKGGSESVWEMRLELTEM